MTFQCLRSSKLISGPVSRIVTVQVSQQPPAISQSQSGTVAQRSRSTSVVGFARDRLRVLQIRITLCFQAAQFTYKVRCNHEFIAHAYGAWMRPSARTLQIFYAKKICLLFKHYHLLFKHYSNKYLSTTHNNIIILMRSINNHLTLYTLHVKVQIRFIHTTISAIVLNGFCLLFRKTVLKHQNDYTRVFSHTPGLI